MTNQCPSCGFSNIEGVDRCGQCFHSMMLRELPAPHKDDHFQQALMTAPVSELITGKDLIVADTEDSVKRIVEVFQKKQKNCVLVYHAKKLVGIISNRDLIRKVAGLHKDLAAVKAKDVMTPNPETVRPEDPISFIVNKMAMGGFRHVPVLAPNGAPISIVNIHDVMHFLSSRQKK